MTPKPFLPISYKALQQYCGMTKTEFENAKRRDPAAWIQNDDGDFSIYHIIEHYRIMTKGNTATKERSEARIARLSDVSDELDRERILQLRIKNQVLLSELIYKTDAESRMLDFLAVLSNKFQFFVKMAANSVIGITNPKHAELILQKEYKQYVSDYMEKHAEHVEWRDEGSSELIRTRILERAANAAEESEIQSLESGAEGFDDCGTEADIGDSGEY